MFNEFGAGIINNELIFTFVFSGENPGVVLYHKNTGKLIGKISADNNDIKGNVCCIRVPFDKKNDIKDIMYLYEYDNALHCDPYATLLYKRIIDNKSNNVDNTLVETTYCGISNLVSCNRKVSDFSKLILYKLHMRGFTMDKRISEGSKGNYKGILSSLPYFKKLGINGLVFFPLYEFDEKLSEKTDFWGYTGKDMFPLAPKSSYFGEDAYNNAVSFFKTLSDNGISSIVEFCFNKNNKLNEELIISSLRHWAYNIGVSGFKFLGDAVPLNRIKSDPYLSDKILIFEENFDDITKGNTCVYNDDFLYTIRKMQNHMDITAPAICGMQRRQGVNYTYINYVSKPNGFTLLDSFSYRDKHNEANGENNVDGNNFNFSDNCGVEGSTKDKLVNIKRLSRIRSSFLLLLLSQSVPLINGGDEMLNSSLGNNNPYCQDNKVGWVNYSRKKDVVSLIDYVGKLISFRKDHGALSNPLPYKMSDYKKTGIPDISYHSREPWVSYLDESKKSVGILLSGSYTSPAHEDVMILINYHNSKEQFTLPVINGKKWYFVTNTLDFAFDSKGKKIGGKGVVTVPGDSVTLLVAR